MIALKKPPEMPPLEFQLLLVCARTRLNSTLTAQLGALAAAVTAYIRVLGGSLGLPQDFRGPMAKPHRMAVLTIACVLGAFELVLPSRAREPSTVMTSLGFSALRVQPWRINPFGLPSSKAQSAVASLPPGARHTHSCSTASGPPDWRASHCTRR